MQNELKLLKNGLIVDGSGKTPAYAANVLISGDTIEKILPVTEIVNDVKVIDCTGKVIAPGFIDAHSHHDWFMASKNVDSYLEPFTKQGITTFIGGNCGFSAAGYKPHTPYKDVCCDNFFKHGIDGVYWDSIKSYFDYINNKKFPSNLAMLAGHGSIRQSISGASSRPLTPNELEELLNLLEKAMDDGAVGVSLGLQYAPGVFTPKKELEQVAMLVAKKNKVLSIHAKAIASFSNEYAEYGIDVPHNVLCLKEYLELAYKAGCKMQWSHVIFPGRATWKSEPLFMETLDSYIKMGMDLKFDTFAYECGTSVITIMLPEWFMAGMPEILNDPNTLQNLSEYLNVALPMTGFTYNDIQIRQANVPELEKYNGWFVNDIANDLGIDPVGVIFQLAKGPATTLWYSYYNEEIFDRLAAHPDCIYATDAWLDPEGVQNPACYGNFPKFLQTARDKNLLSLEQVVYKMTGASAERYGLKERGYIKQGYKADITVFDWENIRDNVTKANPNASPYGIEHVLINGQEAIIDGKYLNCKGSGQTICV